MNLTHDVRDNAPNILESHPNELEINHQNIFMKDYKKNMNGREHGRFYHPFLDMNREDAIKKSIVKNQLASLYHHEECIYRYLASVKRLRNIEFLEHTEERLNKFLREREEEFKGNYALFKRGVRGYTKNYINALRYVIELAEQLLEELYRVKQQI